MVITQRCNFPAISVDRFSDKKGCGCESEAGNWRASLIEALALLSGVPFYLISPVLGALTSRRLLVMGPSTEINGIDSTAFGL